MGEARRDSWEGAAHAAGVRLIEDAEVPAVCAMLARAFDDDPISRYCMPNEARRPAMLRAFFKLYCVSDHYVDFGGGFVTDDLSGAALWAPPGKPRLGGLAALWALLPLAPRVIGRSLPRALGLLARVDSLHPSEPHWYLATIGTEPDRRRGGLGSALMAPALERCDRDGVRAYLESSKLENVPFYRRHGFEVTDEITFSDGPTLWLMWREPGPPRQSSSSPA